MQLLPCHAVHELSLSIGYLVQEEFLSCMKMRMANILKEASAAKDLLAVQHGLKRRSGTLQALTCAFRLHCS
jgi:hypothetical protein